MALEKPLPFGLQPNLPLPAYQPLPYGTFVPPYPAFAAHVPCCMAPTVV